MADLNYSYVDDSASTDDGREAQVVKVSFTRRDATGSDVDEIIETLENNGFEVKSINLVVKK